MKYLDSLMNVLLLFNQFVTHFYESGFQVKVALWLLNVKCHLFTEVSKTTKTVRKIKRDYSVFLLLPLWVLRCAGKTTVFHDSLTKRSVGSSDCSPSSTFLKHIFPFVINSCVFLIIAGTYSMCCFPRMVSKNFTYRSLLVNFTQACADMSWPGLSPRLASWHSTTCFLSILALLYSCWSVQILRRQIKCIV